MPDVVTQSMGATAPVHAARSRDHLTETPTAPQLGGLIHKNARHPSVRDILSLR